MSKSRDKRCECCGRYYKRDPRVGERQRICGRAECRKKLKKASQREWLERNPGYFKGRYANTKEWRAKHPGYQRQWRAKRREIQDEIPTAKPLLTLYITVPVKWLKGEIQDEIRLVRRCGCGYFVSGVGVRDTRSD